MDIPIDIVTCVTQTFINIALELTKKTGAKNYN